MIYFIIIGIEIIVTERSFGRIALFWISDLEISEISNSKSLWSNVSKSLMSLTCVK